MTRSKREQPERYYQAYQRIAVVCLLFTIAAGVYLLSVVSGRLSGSGIRNAAVMLVALYTISFLAVPFITLRRRIWRRSDPEAQLVLRDEWTRRNRDRASWIAFVAVMWGQLPLAFLMNQVTSEPSLSGMAGLSMTLGAGAFFATYLYTGRQQSHG